MRVDSKAFALGITAAFIGGLVVSPVALRMIAPAHGAAPELSATMINLADLQQSDLGNTPYPDLKSKTLVTTDNATVAVQIGNVAKHKHPKTDEIQYIISGSGTIWLGSERKEFKPGTLIIIPKGTAHAGSVVSSGPVKAIAIKIPPQAPGDFELVD